MQVKSIVPMSPKDVNRIVSKGDKAKAALKHVKPGQDDNVIQAAHLFEHSLGVNNRQAWKEWIDTKRKS